MHNHSFPSDDVQEFDTRWDELPLSFSKIPPDDVLESLYSLRLRESDQLKTVLEQYEMDNSSEIIDAQLSKIGDNGEEKHGSETWFRYFDARKGRIETGAVVASLRD